MRLPAHPFTPLVRVGILESGRRRVVATRWLCLLGRHVWRVIETSEGDSFAECARCGKHDWQRVIPQEEGTKWRGGAMPPWGDPGGQ